MIIHPSVACLCIVNNPTAPFAAFIAYLQSIPHMQVSMASALPADTAAYDVILLSSAADHAADADRLLQFVRAGGGLLAMVDLCEKQLPAFFGVTPTAAGPCCEQRVLFSSQQHRLAVRMPDAFYANGCFQTLAVSAPDAELILYVDWHYRHQPVLVARPEGAGQVACTTLQAYDHPVVQQILYRLVRDLAGVKPRADKLHVGLLGYAPWVGKLHASGVGKTPGLVLAGVCDIVPSRREQAQADFPEIATCAAAEDLAADPAVDVVIVATPPNTHAQLCLQMMAAGKHVVCEKPLALNRRETDALAAMAEQQKVHLGCHQNRRWDVDYLAIRQALREGMVGELFYMETFVGGFAHPCGYWHSHAPISGGTAYDWGGHYLDWIVSLMPDRVTAVRGISHKRVWHDVTNADQERIHLLFGGGQEAEFLHSDIAAIRKPKWYLLGTGGAIAAAWQDVTTYAIDPVLYFHPQEIPATEMPPDLFLHRRHPSGKIIAQKLAVPARQDYQFHRNLADHLLTGEPVAAPLEDSVTVVAILEAAARSAARNGALEYLE